MNKNNLIIGLVILVVIGLLFYIFQSNTSENESLNENVEDDIRIEGRVTDVNLEAAIVDGPYAITVDDEEMGEVLVEVPSMGLPLCEAKGNIFDPYNIETGFLIQVRGDRSSSGAIVPCESSAHYLRVVSQ